MLKNLDKWNENEINKRGEILSDLAVKIWPFPELPDDVKEKNKAKEAEESDDEADNKTDYVSEEYWRKRASEISLEIMNNFIKLALDLNIKLAISYNKSHVAIKTSKRNFVWFNPRMGNYNYIGMRFNPDTAKAIKQKIEKFTFIQKEDNTDRYVIFYIPIRQDHLEKNLEELIEILKQAISDSS